MLLDPETWMLSQRADALLAALGDDLAGSCSAETHEAALELTTAPHATVGGAVAELGRLRARLARDARAIGLATAAAGMHPGEMAEDPAGLAGRPLPGGAAHHARDRPPRADVRPARAHRRGGPRERDPAAEPPARPSPAAPRAVGQLAAVARSGDRVGLQPHDPLSGLPAHRPAAALRRTTTTGSPPSTLLLRSGAIPEPTFLWWDVRPQPRFGTVEVRIMDAQPRLEATAALCALVQALARLELEEGYAPRELVHAQEALAENRFLAARDGVAAAAHRPRACAPRTGRRPARRRPRRGRAARRRPGRRRRARRGPRAGGGARSGAPGGARRRRRDPRVGLRAGAALRGRRRRARAQEWCLHPGRRRARCRDNATGAQARSSSRATLGLSPSNRKEES